jgi:hypothetical protein
MPDYQNGKIYTIRCRSDNTLIYVGSTITTLSRRLAEHRSTSKTSNQKLYQSVNGNWSDWYIELYEEFPCDNKQQLNKREGEITREIGNLNYQIAGRTNKEWYNENKDKKKKYYEDNKEKISKQKKEYYENNKEK